ncbi:hypothetical protein JAAARDRAFT_93403, partial [Jaapia argillacea MUCL 33604]
ELQEKLLDGYSLSPVPSADVEKPCSLTKSEMISLRHYSAWHRSNGTVKAYKAHGNNLSHPDAAGTDILSLYSVRKLAVDLTGLKATQVDICPNSCIAYTGEYENLEFCPYICGKTVCGLARYKTPIKVSVSSKKVPKAQMMYLPIMMMIRALFSNVESSRLMRNRDHCLQSALNLIATAQEQSYSDFGNSSAHLHHHQEMGLFQDSRDLGIALSSDGAQLTMKKQSDTWLLILILLNLPAEIQYKSYNTILPLAIPGPNAPGNIESFL